MTTDEQALRDELEFLLASIDDLEREREAGDVDEEDHRRLLDGYTARAARIARLLEDPAPPSTSESTGRRRRPVVAIAVVAVAVLASWFVASSSGQRLPGEQITGLDPRDESQATAFRSVVRSRVERTLSVGGTPYVLLRICGLSFVLHQAARSRLPAPLPAPPRPPPARRRT